MKNLYAMGFAALCLFISTTLSAQEPIPVRQHIPDKPLLFSALPDKFECILPGFDQLAASRAADTITLWLGKQAFTGEIVARVQRSPRVQSINVRLRQYPGAILNLSVYLREDQTKEISGRIIHPQSGDVLVIREENNRYYMEKLPQKFFMTE